jgi:hypothetical protein
MREYAEIIATMPELRTSYVGVLLLATVAEWEGFHTLMEENDEAFVEIRRNYPAAGRLPELESSSSLSRIRTRSRRWTAGPTGCRRQHRVWAPQESRASRAARGPRGVAFQSLKFNVDSMGVWKWGTWMSP